ncbi:MAG: 23S rRNA (guanosine(2251)-2'-O)-methyltransferase RlmB [Methylocystaceae bacterium]
MERLEGINSVLSALEGDREINKILIMEGKTGRSVDKIINLARERQIPLVTLNRQRFESMAQSAYAQGVMAEAKAYAYARVDDILQLAEQRGEEPFIVILDGLEDPQNVGSIIRTAECAGVHGVIIPRHRAAGVTAAVSRASAGALEHMLVAQVANVVQTLEELKSIGCWVIGADMQGEAAWGQAKLPTPAVLVIGSEGKGLHRLVKQKCDLTVRIPMSGHTGSLNASVSAALLIYEVLRGRECASQKGNSPHR